MTATLTDIRNFIARRGATARVPWPLLRGHLQEMKANLGTYTTKVERSTGQHREKVAELKRLQTALRNLSPDTADHLLHHIGRGIMSARNLREWTGTVHDLRGIEQGVDAAIDSLGGKKTARGTGHAAGIRRRFVRESALAYLMAGFDSIPDGPSAFEDWLKLLDRWAGLNLSALGSFKRAIREEIGSNAAARNAWKKRMVAGMEQRNK